MHATSVFKTQRKKIVHAYFFSLIQKDNSTSSDDWVFDLQTLQAAFSTKTKAIVVNTPMNPLGKVLLNFILLNLEFKQYDYHVTFILNIIKLEKLFEERVCPTLFNDHSLNNVISSHLGFQFENFLHCVFIFLYLQSSEKPFGLHKI